MTLISLITSTSSILTVGETNASGLRVLSDGYSNPTSTILTLSILPIEVESATMLALFPFTLTTSSNLGTCL